MAALFMTIDSGDASSLWVSNGTALGTQVIKTFKSFSLFGIQATVGGKYIFSADDGVTGQELGVTDGTSSGTTLLADINTAGSSNAHFHTAG